MKSNDLKITLISPLPPPAGGIATWTKLYTTWLENNNIDFQVVNTALIGKRAEKINGKTSVVDEIKRTKKILQNLNSNIQVYKPNIIHLNTPCGTFGLFRDVLCAQIAKKNNSQLFLHYRCNIEDQIRNNKLKKMLLKRLTNLSDENIVLNQYSKDYLSKEFSTSSVIIPNFADQEFIADTSVSISKNIKNIAFVGHIQKTKGIIEIIRVAKLLPNLNFNLAGPIGIDVETENLPKNINFLGILTKEKTKELLINSDIFLFPTYTEGFSNALLEAMSVGLPIVTTSVGANKDMIEDKGGFLVDVGNYEDIIKSIEKLSDYRIREKMSDWNIKKIKKYYTIDIVMKNLINLYLNGKG